MLKRQALIILLLFFVTSCATWEGRGHGGKGAPQQRGGAGKTVSKEVKKPEEGQFAVVSSPARSASIDMVAKGKQSLAAGKYEKALGIFQEAVIIDSTNGVAYYYLAKTRFNLGQNEEALGILDKAESLLSSADEWMEAITLLRQQIKEAYIAGFPTQDLPQAAP